MILSGRHTLLSLLTALFVLPIAVAPAAAAPLNVNLNLAALPSAQGFTYVASGADAGTPEAGVFSVAGGVLTQNTIGRALGGAGASIYYVRAGGLSTTETKQIRFRARCTAAAGSTGAGGMMVGFSNGSLAFELSITPTQVFTLNGGGRAAAPGAFDNTQFHDYVFDWSPPSSYRVYRDGVLIDTRSGGFGSAANQILIGDSTGGANASGQFASIQFVQDLTTPVTPSTWGRIKSLHR
jgi:hypothetical protein